MNKTFASVLIFSVSMVFAGHEPSVVQLTPPVITRNTILQEVTCTRPMREGRFNISVSQNGNKQVVHCYGHGGSGWTTLFGSVNKAIRLFQSQTSTSQKNPIRVIGSGCMGLTAAIELTRLGYNVTGISTKELYDLCSWKAAGYFALVSVKTNPAEQESLNEIGVETFKTYQQINHGIHPYIDSDAVRFLPVYSSSDTATGVEDLELKGLIPPHEDVILDFGSGVRHEKFIKNRTYFLDTTKLMKALTNEVQRLGIPIEIETVEAFENVAEGVIFDCSGLGGKDLNKDENMIPVRGHLILLNEKSGSEHMDYMIYSKVLQNDEPEYVYMFPKALTVRADNTEGSACSSTLGGTFISNADYLSEADLKELDAKEFQKLLDRTSEFFHGKPYSND